MTTQELVFVSDMINAAIKTERERVAGILYLSNAIYTTDYGDGSYLDWDKSMAAIAEKIREG